MCKTTKLFILNVLLITFVNSVFAYDLPDLGDPSVSTFSPADEQKIGKEFMQEVQQHLSLNTDLILSDYIQNLGMKLGSNTNSKNKSFHFFIVNDPNINAFSGPAGYIGINTGTIIATRSESELAAVLSHEIAHSTQHHIERLMQTAKGMAIPEIAAMAAAVILGATTKGAGTANIASGAATALMAGTAQNEINYTREMEAEADNIGIKTLSKSGYDPKAMPAFFSRMQRDNYDYHREIPDYLIDHPQTNKRIADSSYRADTLPIYHEKANKLYYFMVARTKALMFREGFQAANYFKAQRATKKTNIDAIKYGYAIGLLRNRKFSEASSIVNSLKDIESEVILLPLLEAQIQLENNNAANASSLLKATLNNHPDYFPLIILYAQTLIKAKQYNEAALFLRTKALVFDEKVELYRLLAEAEAKAGHLADAYMAKAKSYEIDGFNGQAIILLQQALKISPLSFNDKAIINARIQRLKQIQLKDSNNT